MCVLKRREGQRSREAHTEYQGLNMELYPKERQEQVQLGPQRWVTLPRLPRGLGKPASRPRGANQLSPLPGCALGWLMLRLS